MKFLTLLFALAITAFIVSVSNLVFECPSRVRVPAPKVHTFKKKTTNWLRYM